MAKLFWLALLTLVTAPPVSAPADAGPWFFAGSSAGLIGSRDGMAQVEVRYTAPAPCYHFASMVQKAPPGAHVPDHALPLTVVVAPQPGPCTRRSAEIRDLQIVHPDLNTNLVRIFFVTPSGHRLKTEQVAITGM